jgi:hypothetical protein
VWRINSNPDPHGDLTQETTILYGLGVGISMVFEIFGNFQYQGDRITPYGHDLHTIRCYLTQEIKIYMV